MYCIFLSNLDYNELSGLKKNDSQNGSVLLMALIFILILSVIGISGTWIASTDLEITRSHKIYNTNFYLADGAAYEAVQRFADNSSLRESSPSSVSWMHDISSKPNDPRSLNWNDPSITTDSDLSAHAKYAVYKNSTAAPPTYTVYARANKLGGKSIVEIKFKED